MYSIFHPLDPDERLPRELLVEGKRYRLPEKSTLFTIVGVAYLPALMLGVIVLGSLDVSALVAFGLAGLALIGVYVYVVSTRST